MSYAAGMILISRLHQDGVREWRRYQMLREFWQNPDKTEADRMRIAIPFRNVINRAREFRQNA